MRRVLLTILACFGLFAGLVACGEGGGDPVAATQQAIAFVLTYQAENPRPSETPWPGAGTIRAILTGQPNAAPVETATPTPSVTPRPVGTPNPEEIVAVPAAAPVLDGVLSPAEWADAAQVVIPVAPDVQVPVAMQHDGTALYLAFSALDQTETALFPEVYIDAAYNRADAWDEDDWWFHLSTQPCQGRGLTAIWSQCGGAQIWRTTTFVDNGAVIEMAIPLAAVGAPPAAPVALGLAVAVMQIDAAGSVTRAFWPERTGITQPSTWGAAMLEEPG